MLHDNHRSHHSSWRTEIKDHNARREQTLHLGPPLPQLSIEPGLGGSFPREYLGRQTVRGAVARKSRRERFLLVFLMPNGP